MERATLFSGKQKRVLYRALAPPKFLDTPPPPVNSKISGAPNAAAADNL